MAARSRARARASGDEPGQRAEVVARLWASRAPLPVTSPAASRRGTPLALAVLCTLLFLTFLDSTIVSVALGNVQTSLHADVGGLQWVVAGYTLTFASIMLA